MAFRVTRNSENNEVFILTHGEIIRIAVEPPMPTCLVFESTTPIWVSKGEKLTKQERKELLEEVDSVLLRRDDG